MHIVCALAYEHRALRRASIGGIELSEPCGPGANAIERWADRFEQEHGAEARERRTPVILAGLAGGLRELWRLGEAAWIREVRMEDGRELEPPYPQSASSASKRASVCSSGVIVRSPAERRTLAERTGCDLVDQESAAFAEAGERYGWRWGIVRGVSDGVGDRLPSGIEAWVDDRGRSRPGRIALDLIRRPSGIPMTGRLSRASRQAMASVAARLAETMELG